MKPPVPVNEEQRLLALHRHAILDTPPEACFDRLTRLAARLFAVPMALVSLVDRDRQWFKSSHGLSVSETPRDLAFCAHTILFNRVLVIPNACEDPRFAHNPLVTGAPGIRFYAGAPLRDCRGHRLGSLCIIDCIPRPQPSRSQLSTLLDLADIASQLIETRRAYEDVLDMATGQAARYVGIPSGQQYGSAIGLAPGALSLSTV